MLVEDFVKNVGKIPIREVLQVSEGTILVISILDANEADIAEINEGLNRMLPAGVQALVTNYDLDVSVLDQEEAEELIGQLQAVLEDAGEDEDY
jgi:hypothetical protein